MEKPEQKECVSLSLCRRTFKLKGNKKSFVPELRSGQVFFVFRDSYVLCTYVMNIICTFHISVSGYGTQVLLWNNWTSVIFCIHLNPYTHDLSVNGVYVISFWIELKPICWHTSIAIVFRQINCFNYWCQTLKIYSVSIICRQWSWSISYFLSRGIIFGIELQHPENPTYVRRYSPDFLVMVIQFTI